MKAIKPGIASFLLMTALTSFSAFSQNHPVGEFDDDTDIGSPDRAGSTVYNSETQEYHMSGSGTNMWFGTDQFHFAWKKWNGDFILRTRIRWIGQGGEPHRKCGWMARAGLEADAPYADCAEHGNGLTSIQFRRVKGAMTEEITLPITNADVLQFERSGNDFIFSAARYGEPFVSRALTNFDLGKDLNVGLFVCSHNGSVVETVVFRDVRIIRPVKRDYTPYRDYIGSVLEILDVQSDELKTVHRSPEPFEAPNWTHDGKSLIYNISGHGEASGRLVRFDLDTKTASEIPIGNAGRCNNDHVLSFDGSQIGISAQSETNGGQSCVFTMPLSGGEARRITPLTPSYLHGWSPDGKWLVYTGGRSNQFDIYKMRSDGQGEEIRLTNTEGLDDGPEFTPDGSFIYFNSSRTGKMQIWRMKPDGTDQKQVTDDEFNNWFPHISPEGKWIVMLSYLPDVSPTDHPYYKQVYLRLMPISGGSPRVIAYVYGGQGTINVPSWSPDSRRIAFVSNSDF